MIAWIRSFLFAIAFAIGTVVAVTLALPFAAMGGRRVRTLAWGWAWFHGWSARTLLGLRDRIEGRIPAGPVLFAAKHQSMYETLELLRILGDPAVVVKKELADIPGWGFVARSHGVIPVDRAGSATTLRVMMAAARAAVDQGRSILIFPEGTRVLPGETPPLRAGFAGLYQLLKLPVVPIALDSGRFYPRKGFLKRPGIVTIRFGEPIPAGLPRKVAEAQVHAAINALEANGGAC